MQTDMQKSNPSNTTTAPRTTTTTTTLSNKDDINIGISNRRRQTLSLTTRDELIAMAQEEYARQLCRFTESQMKKEYRLLMSVSTLYTNEQRQRQQQQQENQEQQQYFNLPKATTIDHNPTFIQPSISHISHSDTNKDVA